MKLLEILAYFTLAVIVGFFLWIEIIDAADLPEQTELTFNDMADLDAQVDSVLGVCDTVRLSAHEFLPPEYYDCSPRYSKTDRDIVLRITCRRFAGLTVFNMPETKNEFTGFYFQDVWHDGKARLWWWEEE